MKLLAKMFIMLLLLVNRRALHLSHHSHYSIVKAYLHQTGKSQCVI